MPPARVSFFASAMVATLAACTAPVDEDVASGEQGATVHASAELSGGMLVVRTSIGASAEDCASCTDADGDGLADEWEDALLDRLRPKMALHPEEPLIDDPDGRFGYVARVFRPDSGRPDLVRVILVTGFSFDPGVKVLGRSVSAHDGDSERVAVELVLRDGGREATVFRVYFAVHEHAFTDSSRTYSAAEVKEQLVFTEGTDVRWLVFPSRAKHPQFANPRECAAASMKGTGLFQEQCAASEAEAHVILPEAVNAGEPGRARVTDLAEVGFPGEEAWIEQRFCGGLREKPRYAGGCAESIASKLLDDPFAPRGGRAGGSLPK